MVPIDDGVCLREVICGPALLLLRSYKELNGLRQRNPGLKTLLAVGGWRFGSQKFSLMANNTSTRQTFVSSAVAFLREHAFDGLVLDWQYPGYRNGNAMDRQNLIALCKELRQAFEDEASGDKRLLLATASPASRSHLDAGYDVAALTRYLDQWHLMTFNYHGPWDRTTGHNSPLMARSEDTGLALTRNMAWTANEYVTRGAPRDKLLLGLSTYARAFMLENSLHITPGSKATIAPSSNYTQEPGFLAYYEVCKIVSEPDANVFLDNEQRVPYLVKKNLWISFDDVNSTKEKAQWLKQQGFGGFVAWTLDTDSFHPDLCNSQSNKAFLLISAAAAVMLDSVQPGASSSSLHNVSTSSTTPSLSNIKPAPVTSPPDGVDRAETTAETATTSPSSTAVKGDHGAITHIRHRPAGLSSVGLITCTSKSAPTLTSTTTTRARASCHGRARSHAEQQQH
ncbi:hypothetical protein C0Q70_00435 [Pomacea canaliculata]|uniref:GH18 domain-containing protein n=1 Tax=Pomacea canaliculata TaxID=400727 RepID=A0A2T7PWN8_POMCA|nr:hypothetical protein C0Q70_00435 [Pomacea canaliculata]